MTTLYHNPRCSKSRQALALLNEKNEAVTIVEYLKEPPSKEDLQQLIALLGIKPIELVRINETLWKENYKGKTLTDTEIIAAMQQHPKLIERPIVIKGNKAVIGRPTEKIITIL